jgi:hypothetical protein
VTCGAFEGTTTPREPQGYYLQTTRGVQGSVGLGAGAGSALQRGDTSKFASVLKKHSIEEQTDPGNLAVHVLTVGCFTVGEIATAGAATPVCVGLLKFSAVTVAKAQVVAILKTWIDVSMDGRDAAKRNRLHALVDAADFTFDLITPDPSDAAKAFPRLWELLLSGARGLEISYRLVGGTESGDAAQTLTLVVGGNQIAGGLIELSVKLGRISK